MNNQISSHQLTAMLLPLIFAPLMMNFSRLVFIDAGRGSWLVIGGIAFGTWLFQVIIIRQYFRNPTSVQENCVFLLGSVPAKLLLLLLALVFLVYSAAALNIGVYTVKLFFLPRTPRIIIALLLFLPAIAMTYCGFRSYTQMATLLLPALFAFLVMFIFTKHNYNPEELFPLGEFQLRSVAVAIPELFITAPGILATFFLLPYLKDTRHLYRKAVLSALLFFGLGLFVYAMALMYFGGSTLPQLLLPFYNLSSIFKGSLAERLDILFMLTLLPAMTVGNGFGIAVANLISENLFLKTYARRKLLPILLMSGAVIAAALNVSKILSLWTLWQFCNITSLILILLMLLLTTAANRQRKRRSK